MSVKRMLSPKEKKAIVEAERAKKSALGGGYINVHVEHETDDDGNPIVHVYATKKVRASTTAKIHGV